jgi:hypothetical protein
MIELNYTDQGRRPSARQIVSDWKKAGRPDRFTAEYGETFAEFELMYGRWVASGNGCRGIQRDKVEALLTAEVKP